MSSWVEGRVAWVRHWADSLYTLAVDASAVTFTAGQFARLALPAPSGSTEPMLGRPYSFVNPPGRQPHEFFFVVLPGGPLSPQLAKLEPAAPIWMLPRGNGFFTVEELPDGESLWCLATGTGLGPFLSILRTPDPWTKFARVVLVHAARHVADLVYADAIAEIAHAHPGAFTFIPVVSRDEVPGLLHGRIPALIEDGRLEAAAGISLSPENAHAMLCGNPGMLHDVQAVLARRGMRRHRRREPGHYTLEAYW